VEERERRKIERRNCETNKAVKRGRRRSKEERRLEARMIEKESPKDNCKDQELYRNVSK
jgi:hypothetical protein